jgi:hypothetical protein
MEDLEYFVMYEIERTNEFVMLSSKTNEIKTYSYAERKKLICYNKVLSNGNIKKCQLGCYDIIASSGYEATHIGLRKYLIAFKKWMHELENNDILKIHWRNYYDNSSAVIMTFKRLTTDFKTKETTYEHHAKIDKTEYLWMHKTHNGGATYCEPQVTQCYGYDYSSCHPGTFSKKTFKIPTSKGTEVYLKTLPEITNIPMGYYRVMVVCNDPNFRKLFTYSKDHTYANDSLYQAMKYKDTYNVSIKLIIDDEPNAYQYDKYETGNKIFGNWHYKMKELKTRFKDNCLIKHLFSSLWGHLARANTINRRRDQVIEQDLDIGFTDDNDYFILKQQFTKGKDADGNENCYYKLLDQNDPYIYNIRLMPFLTATVRNKVARLAMKDIDNVVRIQTDCVVFSKEQIFEKKGKDIQLEIDSIRPEGKTTGLIFWKNCNRSYNFNYRLQQIQKNISILEKTTDSTEWEDCSKTLLEQFRKHSRKLNVVYQKFQFPS